MFNNIGYNFFSCSFAAGNLLNGMLIGYYIAKPRRSHPSGCARGGAFLLATKAHEGFFYLILATKLHEETRIRKESWQEVAGAIFFKGWGSRPLWNFGHWNLEFVILLPVFSVAKIRSSPRKCER
jgi:hypothetical protein